MSVPTCLGVGSACVCKKEEGLFPLLRVCVVVEDEASKPLLGVDRLPIVQTRQAKIQDSPEEWRRGPETKNQEIGWDVVERGLRMVDG